MPYNKSKNKKYKRRNYKKFQLSRMPALTPNRLFRKLRFIQTGDLSVSTGVGTNIHYNLASVYDPVATAGGQQPRGFDQYMNLYDHYTVLGAKITCQVIRHDLTNTSAAFCSLVIKDNNTAPAQVADVLEQPIRKYKLVGNDMRTASTLSLNYSAKKFHGVKDVLDNSNLRGDNSDNPNESAYAMLQSKAINAGLSATMSYITTIDYLVAFTERKQPPQS